MRKLGGTKPMQVTIVYVDVKKGHEDDFLQATKANHLESIKEAGNLRFDVLQSKEDPGKFVLYEAYQNQESAARHKDTPHYLQWRETVADWMAEPRHGVSYQGLFPEL